MPRFLRTLQVPACLGKDWPSLLYMYCSQVGPAFMSAVEVEDCQLPLVDSKHFGFRASSVISVFVAIGSQVRHKS